jgi:uncharacterized protein (TIGR01777 family)
MNVTVTGATGLIGTRIVSELRARGDEVTVLSRSPDRAGDALGVQALPWDLMQGPAPAEALAGRDAVVHLAGEPVDQRWSADSKRRIDASRETGTRNLVEGLRAAEPRPGVLVSASAVGYYGPHGDELVDESTPPSHDFLGEVVQHWEAQARAAEELGMRVVLMRTGIVLDGDGGALKTMLVPFRLGVGGPIAGGHHYIPWIHASDVAGMYLAALDDESWSGPINVTAPEPVTNKAFSKALGRALHRPAVTPVPAFALKALYGEMSEIIVTGMRAVPVRAQQLGYPFRHPGLDEALSSAIDGGG